jgi:hypothetical protein
MGLGGAIVIFFLVAMPTTTLSQNCDPDDVWTDDNCESTFSDLETHIHMHECGLFECYQFFRSPCPGSPNWTLIYEGPNNEFCDTEYDYGSCVIYKGQTWSDITQSGACTGNLHGQGETVCPGGCSRRTSMPEVRNRQCLSLDRPAQLPWQSLAKSRLISRAVMEHR